MVSFETVLLIGVGENLGPAVLQEFHRSSFRVTILSRQGSTSKVPEGVPVVRADYDNPDSLISAMQGQDVVISMVGGHVAGDQNRFIDAALAAGVKRFIPSEFGPYSRDPEFSKLMPQVLPAKAGTVDYLRTKEPKMSWSSLVNGLWFDWAMKAGLLGFDAASKTVTLIDEGTTVLTATTLSTVGKALVAILEHPEETKNSYVFVSSFNISQRDILEVVENIDGQKWTVKHIKSEDIITGGKRKLVAGDFSGIMDLVRGGACGPQGLGDLRPHGLWNDKLGLPKDNIEEAIEDTLYRV